MVRRPTKHSRSLGYWGILGAASTIAAGVAVATGGQPDDLAAAHIGSTPAFAAPAAAAAAVEPSGPLLGDASLRGEIDLSRAKRQGDELVISLDGKRTAVLTLDPAVQARADKVLADSNAIEGAVVVMGLDGRLLAVAGRRKNKKQSKLAVKVWAPAASIFKLVTGAALLESGVTPKGKVCYHGGFRRVDTSMLTDNPGLDRDCADLEAGVARSQNAIIAKLANKHLDRDELADTAERLGFSSAADFALDVEANRFQLPKDEDELELARVAAGFWSTELSPVGAAVLAGSIASGGVRMTPRIVSEVRSPNGTRVVLPVSGERVLEEEIATSLGKMMEETCETGTARSAFRDNKGRRFLGGQRVAGKTGSLSLQKPEYRGFSWFVGYAPADEPAYVVAVLLANPPKWRLKAHTAARLVLESVL